VPTRRQARFPGGFFHLNFISGRADVNPVSEQLDDALAPGGRPAYGLLVQVEAYITRNIDYFRELLVNGVTFRQHVHGLAGEFDHLLERMAAVTNMLVSIKFLTQIVARTDEGTPGVFLLAKAKKVRGVTDLRLHLLFAITVIIVRDDGHDDAALIPRGDFESRAVVVKLALIFPAHAIPSLTRSSLFPMREAEGFFWWP